MDKKHTATADDAKDRQRLWKSIGLPGFKGRLKRPETLSAAPDALPQAATSAEAGTTLFAALGVAAGGPPRVYDTPAGPVVIDAEKAAYIVRKFGDHRERYANRILPTLGDPDEVWRTEYKKGEFRKRHIKLWGDKKATLAIVTETCAGGLLYNFMPYSSGIDNQRKGRLLYRKDEKGK